MTVGKKFRPLSRSVNTRRGVDCALIYFGVTQHADCIGLWSQMRPRLRCVAACRIRPLSSHRPKPV